MVFQNARYCNGFPTLRRNFDPLGVSIYSILSDVFLFVPAYSGHKNGHSRTGKVGAIRVTWILLSSRKGVRWNARKIALGHDRFTILVLVLVRVLSGSPGGTGSGTGGLWFRLRGREKHGD